jgi:uncharacterized protein YlzI (FlbEa/FlbD family)
MPVVLNADLIETIEVTPDTVIRLTTGEKLMVLEPADEVVARVLEFRRAIQAGACLCPRFSLPQSEQCAESAAAPRPGRFSRESHGGENGGS